MSHKQPVHIDFVTEEYAAKLDRFANDHDVPREAAEQAFRAHCEELQGTFMDGTPGGVIRRIAFHKLEWKQTADSTREDSEPSIHVEAGTALQD